MLREFETGNMTPSGDGGKGFAEEVMLMLVSPEWLGTDLGRGKWGRMFHSETTVDVKVQGGNTPLQRAGSKLVCLGS